MKKTFVSNASASMQQYAQQGKKHEYWFSVPQERSVRPRHANTYCTPSMCVGLCAAATVPATALLTHDKIWLNYRALHLQPFEYLKPITCVLCQALTTLMATVRAVLLSQPDSKINDLLFIQSVGKQIHKLSRHTRSLLHGGSACVPFKMHITDLIIHQLFFIVAQLFSEIIANALLDLVFFPLLFAQVAVSAAAIIHNCVSVLNWKMHCKQLSDMVMRAINYNL